MRKFIKNKNYWYVILCFILFISILSVIIPASIIRNIYYNTWNKVDEGNITEKKVDYFNYIIEVDNYTDYIVGYRGDSSVYNMLQIGDYVIIYSNAENSAMKIICNGISYII